MNDKKLKLSAIAEVGLSENNNQFNGLNNLIFLEAAGSALAVNNFGVVAGYAEVATRWTDGTLTCLRNLGVVTAAPWPSIMPGTSLVTLNCTEIWQATRPYGGKTHR